MNKRNTEQIISERSRRLRDDLMTNQQMDIDWKVESIKKLLHEKKKISVMYYESVSDSIEFENIFLDYMKYLNETICRIVNIEYDEHLRFSNYETINKKDI